MGNRNYEGENVQAGVGLKLRSLLGKSIQRERSEKINDTKDTNMYKETLFCVYLKILT